jgi:hypothetical protein
MDIMSIIEEDDKNLLENKRIINNCCFVNLLNSISSIGIIIITYYLSLSFFI